jgi:hypothetical protein
MHDANGYVVAMRSNAYIHQYALSSCTVFDLMHSSSSSSSSYHTSKMLSNDWLVACWRCGGPFGAAITGLVGAIRSA